MVAANERILNRKSGGFASRRLVAAGLRRGLCALWLLVVVSSVYFRYLLVNTAVVVAVFPLRSCVSSRFALVVISRRPPTPEH